MKRTTLCNELPDYRPGPGVSSFALGGLLLLACLATPRASASIYTLPVAGNITANPTGFPGGGTVIDTVTDPFTSSTIDGTVTSSVITNDLSNPYHGLTFTYLLKLSSVSTDSSSEMTIGSYGGFTVDVSYNTNSPGLAPSNFTRDGGTGDTIRFLWSNEGGISPGSEGELIVVQTGALEYTSAGGGVIDSQTVNIATLAPVPEPGVSGLMVTGLGIFFAFRRRSSK